MLGVPVCPPEEIPATEREYFSRLCKVMMVIVVIEAPSAAATKRFRVSILTVSLIVEFQVVSFDAKKRKLNYSKTDSS